MHNKDLIRFLVRWLWPRTPGKWVTESRPLQDISRIRVAGSVLVYFKCEEAVELTVSGRASVVAAVKTYYEGDTLVVETEAADAESSGDRGPAMVVLRLPIAPDVEVQGLTAVDGEPRQTWTF